MHRTAICLLLIMLVGISACSSVYLGGGRSVTPSMGSDTRSDAQRDSDDAVSQAVLQAFARDDILSGERLFAVAKAGEVTLSGSVASFDTRDRAIRVASSTTGVARVNNQIAVNTKN